MRERPAAPQANGTTTTSFPFLWLCGPMGVGKSSVGWEIFTQLRNAGIKTGYADGDQLGLCYPVPEDDPVNHRVKSMNLGAVYHNFRDAGARCPHLVDQAIRQVAELEHATFADLRVDTDDRSVEEVARMVRAKAGNWPGLP